MMKFMVATRKRGLVLQPDTIWDGSKNFKFCIHSQLDSNNYAKNPDDRRSVSGGRTFLNGAPVVFRSATQRFVTLSITEAESASGVMVGQDMLYVYRILELVGLQVALPMELDMDNNGSIMLSNSWS